MTGSNQQPLSNQIMSKPYFHAIYCDDVRKEVGNKQTLVGLYSGELVSGGTFPLVIAKLCIHASFVCTVESAPRSLEFRVFAGEDQIATAQMGPGDIAPTVQRATSASHDVTLIANIIFSPLSLSGPRVLRVEVDADGRVFDGSTLNIREATDAERQQFSEAFS